MHLTAADIGQRAAQRAAFVLRLGSLEPADVRVTGFTGAERLSELFEIRVELVADATDLPLETLVGQACTLEIHTADGTRFLSGIARALARLGEGSRRTHYAVEIVPIQWLLTRRFGSRIFQDAVCPDMSVPGILRHVFERAGLQDDTYRFALDADYAPREYVVQYRETDFDFISRLMEQEGIFYFFEHTADGHVMVIADGPVAHLPNPLRADFPYRQSDGLDGFDEFVFSVRDRQAIESGRCSLDDFDFKRPAVELLAAATGPRQTGLAVDDYPGQYLERSLGERYARMRLEELICSKRQLEFSATARGLVPGQRFDLADHPLSAYNREYLVTRVMHEAREGAAAQEETDGANGAAANSYRAELHVLASDVPFRPKRVTPRPFVHGSQTAIVVGPAGEEIYPDCYGRVKVQFHWDHVGRYDENSSCWIRVSQGSAGGQYGMMFLPRVGQEVIVDFLEGDPDRPIITGRVYNGDHMPPYPLPQEKTRSGIKTHSTPGGGGTNEIRFEDKQGEEQILLYAQKEFHLRSGLDCVETVGGERHLTVECDRRELVKKNQHAEVKLDLVEKVGGDKSLTVCGAVAEKFQNQHSESCGSFYLIAEKGGVIIESAKEITLKVGGNFLKIDAAGVTVLGTIINLNSGGSASPGQGGTVAAPEIPRLADSVTPGRDTRYSANGQESDGVEASGSGSADESNERETLTSWIEIELVDEAGQPYPNEPYEIIEPDAKVRRGCLDKNGQAHVGVRNPGDCQVSFPKLDRRTWERA